jgi:uncharacterized membrane protein SpoIIM required for sporulation
MDIDTFIADRRPRWEKLERLLDDTQRVGDRGIDPLRVQELVRLYRQACSDLNHARSLTANPLLIDRLNQLTGRGYRFVYQNTKRARLWGALKNLFLTEIPVTFRQEASVVLMAAAAMFIGALLGFVIVVVNPHHAHDLVPSMFFSESPRERVERLEKEGERIDTAEKAATFGAYLFTHNIQVSFLAFSLGALTIIGGFWILWLNGVILGAVAAQYYLDGVTTFFMAWVGPHGVLELPAIIFAGAAGIKVGGALLVPGNLTRKASVRLAFPSVRRMILATCAILVVAGLIEGSFSQFTSKTIPYDVKITVACLLFLLLIVYLFVFKRRAA